MSQRRRYLVTYDIREPKRLRQVYRTMKAYGEPLQYSVFSCDLSTPERLAMIAALNTVTDSGQDSIMIVDLGHVSAPLRTEHIGVRRILPEAGPVII